MSNSKSFSTFTPAMIDGVTASKVFLPVLQNSPASIFDFLCSEFPHIPQQEWQQRFENQLILAMNGEILTGDSAYIANQHIYYYRFLAHEIHVPFKEAILFENNDLLVVDKPHFLTISPTGQYVQETLLVRLKNSTQNPELSPIHRLDRETTGIVLFSKRAESRGAYQQLFANRKVQKIYHAIAPFHADLSFPRNVQLNMQKGQPFFTMQVRAGEPNSHTHIEMIEHNETWALYLLKPITGKQHQLRVHLNYLNIPIQNDPFYPQVIHKQADDFSSPLQLLAKEIYFTDPLTLSQMHFKSNLVLTL